MCCVRLLLLVAVTILSTIGAVAGGSTLDTDPAHYDPAFVSSTSVFQCSGQGSVRTLLSPAEQALDPVTERALRYHVVRVTGGNVSITDGCAVRAVDPSNMSNPNAAFHAANPNYAHLPDPTATGIIDVLYDPRLASSQVFAVNIADAVLNNTQIVVNASLVNAFLVNITLNAYDRALLDAVRTNPPEEARKLAVAAAATARDAALAAMPPIQVHVTRTRITAFSNFSFGAAAQGPVLPISMARQGAVDLVASITAAVFIFEGLLPPRSRIIISGNLVTLVADVAPALLVAPPVAFNVSSRPVAPTFASALVALRTATLFAGSVLIVGGDGQAITTTTYLIGDFRKRPVTGPQDVLATVVVPIVSAAVGATCGSQNSTFITGRPLSELRAANLTILEWNCGNSTLTGGQWGNRKEPDNFMSATPGRCNAPDASSATASVATREDLLLQFADTHTNTVGAGATLCIQGNAVDHRTILGGRGDSAARALLSSVLTTGNLGYTLSSRAGGFGGSVGAAVYVAVNGELSVLNNYFFVVHGATTGLFDAPAGGATLDALAVIARTSSVGFAALDAQYVAGGQFAPGPGLANVLIGSPFRSLFAGLAAPNMLLLHELAGPFGVAPAASTLVSVSGNRVRTVNVMFNFMSAGNSGVCLTSAVGGGNGTQTWKVAGNIVDTNLTAAYMPATGRLTTNSFYFTNTLYGQTIGVIIVAGSTARFEITGNTQTATFRVADALEPAVSATASRFVSYATNTSTDAYVQLFSADAGMAILLASGSQLLLSNCSQRADVRRLSSNALVGGLVATFSSLIVTTSAELRIEGLTIVSRQEATAVSAAVLLGTTACTIMVTQGGRIVAKNSRVALESMSRRLLTYAVSFVEMSGNTFRITDGGAIELDEIEYRATFTWQAIRGSDTATAEAHINQCQMAMAFLVAVSDTADFHLDRDSKISVTRSSLVFSSRNCAATANVGLILLHKPATSCIGCTAEPTRDPVIDIAGNAVMVLWPDRSNILNLGVALSGLAVSAAQNSFSVAAVIRLSGNQYTVGANMLAVAVSTRSALTAQVCSFCDIFTEFRYMQLVLATGALVEILHERAVSLHYNDSLRSQARGSNASAFMLLKNVAPIAEDPFGANSELEPLSATDVTAAADRMQGVPLLSAVKWLAFSQFLGALRVEDSAEVRVYQNDIEPRLSTPSSALALVETLNSNTNWEFGSHLSICGNRVGRFSSNESNQSLVSSWVGLTTVATGAGAGPTKVKLKPPCDTSTRTARATFSELESTTATVPPSQSAPLSTTHAPSLSPPLVSVSTSPVDTPQPSPTTQPIQGKTRSPSVSAPTTVPGTITATETASASQRPTVTDAATQTPSVPSGCPESCLQLSLPPPPLSEVLSFAGRHTPPLGALFPLATNASDAAAARLFQGGAGGVCGSRAIPFGEWHAGGRGTYRVRMLFSNASASAAHIVQLAATEAFLVARPLLPPPNGTLADEATRLISEAALAAAVSVDSNFATRDPSPFPPAAVTAEVVDAASSPPGELRIRGTIDYAAVLAYQRQRRAAVDVPAVEGLVASDPDSVLSAALVIKLAVAFWCHPNATFPLAFTLLPQTPPTPLLAPGHVAAVAVAAAASAAVATGLGGLAAGASSAAIDLQTVALLGMLPCAEGAAKSSQSALGAEKDWLALRTLSPTAFAHTCQGALWGSLVLIAVITAAHGAAVFVWWRQSAKGSDDNDNDNNANTYFKPPRPRLAAVIAVCDQLQFPSIPIMVAVLLQTGLLSCSVEVITAVASDLDVASRGFVSVVVSPTAGLGAVALVFVVAFAASSVAGAALFVTRAYQPLYFRWHTAYANRATHLQLEALDFSAAPAPRPLLTFLRLAPLLFLPRGESDAAVPTTRMLRALNGNLRLPGRLWPATRFFSIAAVAPCVAAAGAPKLCQPLYVVSATLHLALALLVGVRRPYTILFRNATGVAALLLNGIIVTLYAAAMTAPYAEQSPGLVTATRIAVTVQVTVAAVATCHQCLAFAAGRLAAMGVLPAVFAACPLWEVVSPPVRSARATAVFADMDGAADGDANSTTEELLVLPPSTNTETETDVI